MPKDGVSILVADKNHPDISDIKAALADYDDQTYKIDTARSGKATLKKAEGNHFDLMLVDQDLPGLNGIEMLRELTERKLGMPVIMIVAAGKEKQGVRAMDKGAYDYLTKEEIKTVALSRAIRRAMQRKKLEEDITASIRKLEKLAIRDGLTGLYNHHHFREVLKNEFKKAKRHIQPLSCIMLDLDHFKSVNDSHGHQFGDYVLAQSAKILKKLVRDTDFVARYGGEEFFIVLPNTELNGSFILAERIRCAFEKYVFKKGDISAAVTVSMGISSTSDDNVINDVDIIANADKALYRAKWRGRNNVCTYEVAEQEETFNIREEVEKIEDFNSRFRNINENIKENCIESAHDILRDIERGWDHINEHSIRVSRLADRLSRQLSLSEDERNTLKRAALLHDIGMVGVSSSILRKKGKLTREEYNVIKRHSNIGVKIIEKTKLFEKEMPIVLYHHERFDGKGYPHKLKGDAIPYGARILAVAEAYDAMITESDYRKAGSSKRAVAELKKCAGSQFDPEIVKAFVKAVERTT